MGRLYIFPSEMSFHIWFLYCLNVSLLQIQTHLTVFKTHSIYTGSGAIFAVGTSAQILRMDYCMLIVFLVVSLPHRPEVGAAQCFVLALVKCQHMSGNAQLCTCFTSCLQKTISCTKSLSQISQGRQCYVNYYKNHMQCARILFCWILF